SKNNDVVIIQLDRPRELRFGHKALKQLMAMTGKGFEHFEEGNFDLEEIEKILYCGLLSDARANSEEIRLEDMEDLLDQASSFAHVMEKMTEAFNAALGNISEGNLLAPGSPAGPARSKNGTG